MCTKFIMNLIRLPDHLGCNHEQQVTCSSSNYAREECLVHGAGLVTEVDVSNQLSGSACTLDVSYGLGEFNTIWVDKGCRAEFDVCYYPGNFLHYLYSPFLLLLLLLISLPARSPCGICYHFKQRARIFPPFYEMGNVMTRRT